MIERTVRSIETSAPPDAVFAVASDLENYPSWASAVKEVEVLEHGDDGLPARAQMSVDIMIKQISYVLTYTWDAPHAFEWSADPSADLKELEGRYEFNELDDGGTEIVYALRVEPAFSLPGFLRKQAEKQIVGTALRELKRQAEESVAG